MWYIVYEFDSSDPFSQIKLDVELIWGQWNGRNPPLSSVPDLWKEDLHRRYHFFLSKYRLLFNV
jgi:hypothetical protein